MSGILDNKNRIMDVIITKEGRRQMANGDIRIEFGSFTDCHTFYEADIHSGSSDASSRLYFEVASSISDQITFETDDSGNMIKFQGGDVEYDGDRIYKGTSGARLGEVTDSTEFASTVNNLLRSSINNFKRNMLIGTNDPNFELQDFKLSQNYHKFKLSTKTPVDILKEIDTVDINSIEPLFLDKRMTHLDNFKFMPPVNSIDGAELAEFSDLNDGHDLSVEKLKAGLENRPYVDVEFQNTSYENNLIAQFFEVKNKSMTKLDVVDFGEYVDADGEEFRIFFRRS